MNEITKDLIERFKKKHKKENLYVPTDNEIDSVKAITDFKLPNEYIEALSECVPEQTLTLKKSGLCVLNIREIILENTNAVPGYVVLKHGFFVFMRDRYSGDGICMDLEDENFGVYVCSHSLFSDEDKISMYINGKMVELPMCNENIKKYAYKYADSFESFIYELSKNNLSDCNVSLEEYAKSVYRSNNK